MTDSDQTRVAIALHYDGIKAPVVTAKGSGDVAKRIIEIAKEHNIPLKEDAALVELLAQLQLGDDIPEPLFIAVAEVIAFAYFLSGKRPEGYEKTT